MLFRIGQFLLFVGLLFCLLFYASYAGGKPDETFLGWAFILLTVSIFIMLRNRKPSAQVERFRSIHSYQQRQEQRRKERDEKRKAREEARLAKKRK